MWEPSYFEIIRELDFIVFGKNEVYGDKDEG
jgi:hypothetical protein